MDNKELKLKFSGISFGGLWGGGTTVFSKHYKMMIEKNRKTKKYNIQIKENKTHSVIVLFLMFALPLDTIYYLVQFHPTYLNNVADAFVNFVWTIFSFIPTIDTGIPSIPLPSIVLPVWVVNIIGGVLIIVNFLLMYFLVFRGVATWHGCEHKIIDAAEHNDIENARNYSRINDRCGGCFIFTAYTFMAVYWLMLYYVFGIFLPVGMLTLSYLLMFLEAKYFHKYNWVGIRVGRLLQQKLTTSEPLDFQITLGIKGMKKLIEKEKQYARKHDV